MTEYDRKGCKLMNINILKDQLFEIINDPELAIRDIETDEPSFCKCQQFMENLGQEYIVELEKEIFTFTIPIEIGTCPFIDKNIYN